MFVLPSYQATKLPSYQRNYTLNAVPFAAESHGRK